MPRFAWLWHATPLGANIASHYDLMLEKPGATMLMAFAFDKAPSRVRELRTHGVAGNLQAPLPACAAVRAVLLVPHRLVYLDYEGPLSNGRGEVAKKDFGRYKVIEGELTSSQFVLKLQGMQGSVVWEFQQDRARDDAEARRGFALKSEASEVGQARDCQDAEKVGSDVLSAPLHVSSVFIVTARQ